MKVNLSILRLADQRFSQRDAHKIRGYIGHLWEEFDLLHNHAADGRSQYRYPLVQYKVLQGVPHIVGLGAGVQLLEKVFLELKALDINGQLYENLHKELICHEVEFGDAQESILYQFMTPWLALNQENYQKFRRYGLDLSKASVVQHEVQLDMLQSILINNIIAVAKSLKYTIQQRHKPQIVVEPCEVQFKNQPMVAFKGFFKINFHLPDLIGLGKSPARGFGTVQRLISET